MNITVKRASFKLHKISLESSDVERLHDILITPEHQYNPAANQPGFRDLCIEVLPEHPTVLAGEMVEIVSVEVPALNAEGQQVTYKHNTMVTARFILAPWFLAVQGKPAAISTVRSIIETKTRQQLLPFRISPQHLENMSDHMSFIKGLAMSRLTDSSVKSVKLSGKIETMSDIAPFDQQTEHLSEVKGVLSIGGNIRTVKVSCDGTISMTLKSGEDLNTDDLILLYKWLDRGRP